MAVWSGPYDNASGTAPWTRPAAIFIKLISGNDIGRLVWVQDQFGNLDAVTASSASFSNGYAIVVVPNTNLDVRRGAAPSCSVGSTSARPVPRLHPYVRSQDYPDPRGA